ncbi:MAG: hypothetical protein ACU836_06325 [Gammaproteobacteria bacterium]
MSVIKKYDQNNTYMEVKQAIKGLRHFDNLDNEDDIIYAINKLNSVLRMVHDNCQSWTNEAIRDFVLKKNDPLRYICVNSDTFNDLVRKIQEDMIVKYS